MKGYAWVVPQDNDHLQFVKGSMDELKSYNFSSGNFTHRVSGASLLMLNAEDDRTDIACLFFSSVRTVELPY